MWIWLPGAAVGAALVGIIVVARRRRLRGLYLAIVTVGLVFIGIHLSRVFPEISGGAEVGRHFPPLELKLWKEEEPIISFSTTATGCGSTSPATRRATCSAGTARHRHRRRQERVRTRTGGLQAIRDRDVAAEIMGVPESRYKLIAFASSSFFAGVAGALFASFVGKLHPSTGTSSCRSSSSPSS